MRKRRTLAQSFNESILHAKKQMREIPDIMTVHSDHLDEDIPDSVEIFYQKLGYPFLDSKTNQPIKKFTNYQRRIIEKHKKHKKLLVLKSQKIGLSSLCIIITLWHALTDCQGFEIIILAQNKDKAIQHAQDLRKFIAKSRYANYLIQKPQRHLGLMRDEVTKMTDIYIHNRSDLTNPTQIHILSPTVGSLASLKRVKFAWCSDITLVKDISRKQELYFIALMSRLILTEGHVLIECPTVGHLGPIYTIDDNYNSKMASGKPLGKYDFRVERIKVQEAIDAGLMNEEAVQALRDEHGPMFSALFEADWFAGDNSWFSEKQFQESDDANYYVEDDD